MEGVNMEAVDTERIAGPVNSELYCPRFMLYLFILRKYRHLLQPVYIMHTFCVG